MTIEQAKIGKSGVVLSLDGRLDTASAPMLERKIKQWGADVSELTLDFKNLVYISSMGLRVLLQAMKEFKKTGRQFTVKNMNDSVKEVFQMTGFLNLMVHDEKFVVIRKDEPDAIVLSLIGEMQSSNVNVLSKELADIKTANASNRTPVTVILDMAKLARVSPSVGRLLKKVLEDTKWPYRELHERNMTEDMWTSMEDETLREIL